MQLLLNPDKSDDQLWVEDRDGQDPPVVLLHPGWGDSTIWDGVIARLPPAVRVIRFDNRGYGRSPAPSVPFTSLADLVAVLEQRQVTRAVVVGHSGGGATAINLALDHPGMAGSLILLAPGVSDYPWPQEDPYFARFGALAAAGDRDGLVSLGLRTWAAGESRENGAEAQIRGAVAAMFAQDDYLLDDPPALGRLAEIKVPARLVIGDRDHHSVIACASAVAAGIDGSDLTTLPGADHLLPLTRPDLIAGLITQAARP